MMTPILTGNSLKVNCIASLRGGFAGVSTHWGGTVLFQRISGQNGCHHIWDALYHWFKIQVLENGFKEIFLVIYSIWLGVFSRAWGKCELMKNLLKTLVFAVNSHFPRESQRFFSMKFSLLLCLGHTRIIKSVHIDVSCWSWTAWSTSVNTISWFIGIFGPGHSSRDTSQFWNMCRFYPSICRSFNEWRK